MANSIVGGLFGADPAVLQAQQRQADMENAAAYAQMTPMQRANASIYQGAAGLGRAAGGLLGIQDPMIQQATELKQIASQFDITTPEGLTQLAQAISGKYPQQAQQAVAAAQKMKLDQATIYQKTGENLNALIASGKYTPESLSKFQQTRNAGDLVPLIAPEKMGETTIKEVATAEKNNTILTNSNVKLDTLIKEVETGDIQFGLGNRIRAFGQRWTGTQDANTRKIDSLEKFMETERNNILLSAKGTQTEGDATRAMDQILKRTDMNNQESVRQALTDLKAYKESQIVGNNAYIEALKGQRKLGGTSPASQTPAAPNKSVYDRVRAKQGWGDASDAEIDNAIKAGKIKVGAIK
jgi:hypothetical protein